jgi:hypothetical protein
MSLFALLRGETLDYADRNIKVNLRQFSLPPHGGEVWCPDEIGSFSCLITNLGVLQVTNFKIHIYTNEYGQLRTLAGSCWTKELKFGPFTIDPNGMITISSLQFKAFKKTDIPKDYIFAYVEVFDLSWYYPKNDSSLLYLDVNKKNIILD